MVTFLYSMFSLMEIFEVAELNLARFIEDLVVQPKMIETIVDGEVNEEYVRTLQMLSKKLKFIEVDPMEKKNICSIEGCPT